MRCKYVICILLVYTIMSISIVSSKISMPSRKLSRRIKGKIVGGEECNMEDYPFVVSIRVYFNNSGRYEHICGGSLIAHQWVLTSAHCFLELAPTETIRVFTGNSLLTDTDKWFKASRRVIHKNFSEGNELYDIALIKLHRRVSSPGAIIQIPISRYEDDLSMYCHPKNFRGAGWGSELAFNENQTEAFEQLAKPSRHLKCAKLPYITKQECDSYFFREVNDNVMCTAGDILDDICIADSGGPLFCDGVQYGIISYGYGCGQPDSPSLFVRVDRKLDFIFGEIPFIQLSKCSVLSVPSILTIFIFNVIRFQELCAI